MVSGVSYRNPLDKTRKARQVPGMTNAGRNFLWAAAGFGIIIDMIVSLMLGCNGPLILNAINSGSAANCAEFWLNRYQTLIAGTAALLGALITVKTMMRQTEMGRADDADRRLARYAGAIINLMQRETEAVSTESDEEDAALMRAVNIASDDPAIREAMIDGAMGEDTKMVAFFVNACRQSALAKVYNHPDPQHENIVWPLYNAITDGILKRQSMLRSGQKLSDLHVLSTINQAEVQNAFIEGRMPLLD
jgi:hypothetical protein